MVKSLGMAVQFALDHEESDSKLKFLEKHLQGMNKSVQIFRDKQELSDTQKEPAAVIIARKNSFRAIIRSRMMGSLQHLRRKNFGFRQLYLVSKMNSWLWNIEVMF
ncbi:hypothetical protein Hdeb2414_s0003g00105831 [Helianthus debilis subsp. tardiflorus]